MKKIDIDDKVWGLVEGHDDEAFSVTGPLYIECFEYIQYKGDSHMSAHCTTGYIGGRKLVFRESVIFKTFEEAKKAGEEWLNGQG